MTNNSDAFPPRELDNVKVTAEKSVRPALDSDGSHPTHDSSRQPAGKDANPTRPRPWRSGCDLSQLHDRRGSIEIGRATIAESLLSLQASAPALADSQEEAGRSAEKKGSQSLGQVDTTFSWQTRGSDVTKGEGEGARKRKLMRRESIRLSDADSESLAVLAGGRSKGALVRQWIQQATANLDLTPLPRDRKKRRPKAVAGEDFRLPPDPELVRQLVMLSNMHFEIAKQLLSCRQRQHDVDVEKVLFVLVLINGHLEYLVENYTIATAPVAGGTREEPSK